MLANHTDRIYCDVEDITFALQKLAKASAEFDVRAEEAEEVTEAYSYIVKSSLYTGAMTALHIIATEKVVNANDFMVKFERYALGKFTNDKE